MVVRPGGEGDVWAKGRVLFDTLLATTNDGENRLFLGLDVW